MENRLSLLKYVVVSFIFFCSSLWATTIYKYRIFCQTENQFVYLWSETSPTQCPNNSSDSVNLNSISIVDEISTDLITIKDEYVPTGHNFKTETRKISVAAGPDVTSIEYFSWPFNITVMNMYFVTTDDHQGDIIRLDVPFDRVIGALTSDISTGTTEIPVSQTVIDNVYVGYMIYLDDGTNNDELGRIIAIDTADNTITLETATSYDFQAATPTYVKMTRRSVDFEIGSPQQYSIGMKTITGSHLPANEQARVQYINKSSVSKDFIIIYEYLY